MEIFKRNSFVIGQWGASVLLMFVLSGPTISFADECFQSFDIDDDKTITKFNLSLDSEVLVETMSCEYAAWLHEEMLFGDENFFSVEDYENYDNYLEQLEDINNEAEDATEELLQAIEDDILADALSETASDLNNAAFLISAIACILEPTPICKTAMLLTTPGMIMSASEEEVEWTTKQNELRLYLEQLKTDTLEERLKLEEKYNAAKARRTIAAKQLCKQIVKQCL